MQPCRKDTKIISEQLGHASVAFTLDVYSHLLPHMQDAAAEKVQALLGVPKPDAKPQQTAAGLTPVADFRISNTLSGSA